MLIRKIGVGSASNWWGGGGIKGLGGPPRLGYSDWLRARVCVYRMGSNHRSVGYNTIDKASWLRFLSLYAFLPFFLFVMSLPRFDMYKPHFIHRCSLSLSSLTARPPTLLLSVLRLSPPTPHYPPPRQCQLRRHYLSLVNGHQAGFYRKREDPPGVDHRACG